MTKQLDHQSASQFIEDGDLIGVCRSDTLVSKLTRFFTRRKHTHTGLAIWDDDELYLAELNGGGNHKVPMSQLDGVPFDVFARPPEVTNVRQAIAKWLKVPIHYGYTAFVAIGVIDFFKLKLRLGWRSNLVCVGWCIAVWEDSGWPRRPTRITSPGELVDQLQIKFIVR